ncbi:hypothetical protein SAMN05192544_109930 [Paraburkholderia hospita]|nr:hypothetical protein SAMN05192544_109930 [Paraburkholderia hospita]
MRINCNMNSPRSSTEEHRVRVRVHSDCVARLAAGTTSLGRFVRPHRSSKLASAIALRTDPLARQPGHLGLCHRAAFDPDSLGQVKLWQQIQRCTWKRGRRPCVQQVESSGESRIRGTLIPGRLAGRCASAGANRRPLRAGWKYTPPIIVPEKEYRHASSTRSFDADVAPLIRAHATEPSDVSRRGRSRCKPFVDQSAQRMLSGVHDALLPSQLHAADA